MAKARHRRPSTKNKNLQRAAVVTATGAAIAGHNIVFPASAFAQPASAWDALIRCESDFENIPNTSGASTASGYFQIVNGTWRGAGGVDKYGVTRAMDASFEAQADIAQVIAERRGSLADWNASKHCWGDEITSEVPDGPAVNPFAPPPAAAPPPPPPAPVADEPVAAPQVITGGERVVAKAKEYFGAQYVWGGDSYEEGGFDCSGLTYRVFADLGVELPRTSAAQASAGTAVNSIEEAQPGDLLLFDPDGDGKISHVAIYTGNNRMIDSSNYGDVVREKDVWGIPVAIRHVAVGDEQIAAPESAPEAPAVEETPEAPVEGTYTVAQGDSLISIGRRLGMPWEELARLNGLDNPWTIYPGQVLQTAEAAPVEIEHIVQPGEWLSTIAQDYEVCEHGEDITTCWHELYERNKETIGDDPNRLFPGQALFVGGLYLPQEPATVVEDAPVAESAPAVEEAPVESAPEAEAPVVSAGVAHPVPGRSVNSGYGARWGSFHDGVDFDCVIGEKVYVAADGVVETSEHNNGGYGNWVRVRHNDGSLTFYAHLDSRSVGVGDVIVAGQQVGACGNTGHVVAGPGGDGSHLHFGAEAGPGLSINPINWANDRGLAL